MARLCPSAGAVAAPVARGGARQRFEDTDRFARGRIVAALAAGEAVPAASGRSGPSVRSRGSCATGSSSATATRFACLSRAFVNRVLQARRRIRVTFRRFQHPRQGRKHMALDRQSVIRTDFPMSRRGYDRIAVDRHLDEIAQQLDGIERPVSVGATTSAHVQSILDAAEASAARDRAPRMGRRDPRPGRGRPGSRRARVQVQALAAASRSLRERLDGLLTEVEALEGNLAEPGLRTAEAEPAFDPQDTMAFDPIAEDEVAAQTAARPDGVALRPRRAGDRPPHRVAHADAGRRRPPGAPRPPSRPARRRARAPGSSR